MKPVQTLFALTAISLLGSSVAMAAPAAGALSASECHKAFQSAKKDGSLNGQKYAAFKAEKCAGKTEKTEDKPATSESASSKTTAPKDSASAAPMTSGNVVFPSKVSAEFSSLTPGKARMKTCLSQYNANKANGGNGSLKWIQRGGGYYSQCNARLKGSAAQ